MTTTRRGAQRERTPGQVEEAIIDLTLRGYTPVQINQVLPGVVRDIAKKQGWKNYKAPHLRTIQRIARRAKPVDESGEWAIELSTPDDARVVLDFMADAADEFEGDVARVTRAEAEWIVRLRRLGPPMTALQTMRLMSLYQARRSDGLTTEDLDAFLAFSPWLGRRRAARYASAVLRNSVLPAPQWIVKLAALGDWLDMEVVAVFDPWLPVKASALLSRGEERSVEEWLEHLGRIVSAEGEPDES